MRVEVKGGVARERLPTPAARNKREALRLDGHAGTLNMFLDVPKTVKWKLLKFFPVGIKVSPHSWERNKELASIFCYSAAMDSILLNRKSFLKGLENFFAIHINKRIGKLFFWQCSLP